MADAPATMKSHNPQYVGLWLDHEQAILITHDDESGEFVLGEKIKSNHSHGGGGEYAINHAERSETVKFFKTVATHLHPFDEILVFGPGKSQEQFKNHLDEDAQFNTKQITLQSAEHMTPPQMLAQVRDFYKSRSPSRAAA